MHIKLKSQKYGRIVTVSVHFSPNVLLGFSVSPPAL